MTIKFCVSAYTDPAHFGRLLQTLSALDCEFYVHVDARVDQGPFQQQAAGLRAKCHFLERRFPVRWGGFSQVRYQRAMLEAACRVIKPEDRVFLISGTDYPICSASAFLARLEGSGDLIRAAPIPRDAPTSASDRYRLVHLRDIDLGSGAANRAAIALVREASRLVSGWRDRRLIVEGQEWLVHVGSSYLCLGAECARHALAMLDKNPQIERFFRHGFVSEEMIWHTVLMNSPFRERFLRVDHTFGLEELSATHYFEYNAQVEVIDSANLPRALASGKLLGRKFATGRSNAALSQLDELWAG